MKTKMVINEFDDFQGFIAKDNSTETTLCREIKDFFTEITQNSQKKINNGFKLIFPNRSSISNENRAHRLFTRQETQTQQECSG